jgi:predicted MFS family arabinose efflux permease
LRNRVLLGTFICYALFGAGYTAAATFFVAFLRDDRGFGSEVANLSWTFAGLSATVGPFLFGALRDSLGSRPALAAAHTAIATAIMLLVVAPAPAFALAGGVLFGASFIGLGTIVVVYAREVSSPDRAARAIGFAIVCVSVGQAAGPALAGTVAEVTASLAIAFIAAAAACAAGAVFVLVIRGQPDGGERAAYPD